MPDINAALEAASAEPKPESAVTPPMGGGDDRFESALRAFEAAGGGKDDETPTDAPTTEEQAAPVQHEAAAVEPTAVDPKAEEKAERLKSVQATASAVRAERRARAAEKSAKAALAEKAAWEASKASWKDNPDALLERAGLTPEQFLEHRVKQALGAPPPDPVDERVKQVLAPHLQALEAERDQLQQHQNAVAEANVMARQVLPIVGQLDNGNPKYEALLAHVGDDPNRAAVYVYETAKKHFMATGESVPFNLVADYLEQQHTQFFDAALGRASKMHKFQSRFSSGNGTPSNPGPRTQGQTLTNKHGPAITPSPVANAVAASKPKAVVSDVDALIKKHGFDRAL